MSKTPGDGYSSIEGQISNDLEHNHLSVANSILEQLPLSERLQIGRTLQKQMGKQYAFLPETDLLSDAAQSTSAGHDQDKHSGNWVLAVDLDVILDGRGAGTQDQLSRIKALADKTKGTGVTIVAQAFKPADNAPQEGTSDQSTPGSLERYVIRDGKIVSSQDVPSEGTKQDLTNLLKLAAEQGDSKNLGLIWHSHGNGMDGLGADSGHMSVDEMQNAIKNGLQGTSRQKLDLLDLDSCEMANVGVLSHLAPTTKQLVASSEDEAYSEKHREVDSQNLQAVIGDLLKAPQMNAAQLADRFVSEADAGANGRINPENYDPHDSGTPTLAHFDMDHWQQFSSSLDQFGQALTKAMSNPKTASEIEDAIHATVSAIHRDPDDQMRDLKTFIQNVKNGVNDSEVQRLASDLQSQSALLVQKFHGDTAGGYSSEGGVSAFLPDEDFRDVQTQAQQAQTPTQLLDQLRSSNSKPDSPKILNNANPAFERTPQETVAAIDENLQKLRQAIPSGHESELQNVQESTLNLKNAVGTADYQDSLAKFHQAATALEQDPEIAKALMQIQENRLQQRIGQRLQTESLAGVPNWDSFIHTISSPPAPNLLPD